MHACTHTHVRTCARAHTHTHHTHLHYSEGHSQMMILQYRVIIVEDGQFMASLYQELVVLARVVHIVHRSGNQCSKHLQFREHILVGRRAQ